MFVALLSFVKTKLFSQVGGFLLPFVVLLGVFLIWNSDLILTNFGYETRSNLKAEIVRLNAEVEKLKEVNLSNTDAAVKVKEDAKVTVSVLEATSKETIKTLNTIDDIKRDREKKSMLLLSDRVCDEVTESIVETKVEASASTESPPKPGKLVKTSKPISNEVVNRLSEDNIDAINLAYDSLFPETSL